MGRFLSGFPDSHLTNQTSWIYMGQVSHRELGLIVALFAIFHDDYSRFPVRA